MNLKVLLWAIYYLFIPIIALSGLVGLLLYGVIYWVDISGQPKYISRTIDGVKIFYPEIVRPGLEYEVEIEPVVGCMCSGQSIKFQESELLKFEPDSAILQEVNTLKIHLTVRNLKTVSGRASFVVHVYEANRPEENAEEFFVRVDNWTKRIVAIISGLGGLLGLAGAAANFVKSIRS